MHAKQVTDGDFARHVDGSTGVVLVDFWAEWCGPCRMVGPVLEQLARDHAGEVTVLKLDVDANPVTTARFNVRSIPSILLFKDGKHVDTIVGADPRLRAILEDRINRAEAALP
jgi:thioredoxin 1